MYGYKTVDGKPVIDPQQAVILKLFFRLYLSGMGLKSAAVTAGIGENVEHVSAKIMLMNRRYIGEGDYPAIIDKGVFDQAQEEIRRRGEMHTRRGKPVDNVQRQAKGECNGGTVESTVESEPVQVSADIADASAQPQPPVFIMREPDKSYDDPAAQAEYLYSLIEEG